MRKLLAKIIASFIPFRRARRKIRAFIRGDARFIEANRCAWVMYSNCESREAIAKYISVFDKKVAWKHAPHDLWLVYVSALYELGRKKDALSVLKHYYKQYETFDIFRYVLAAKCALENGITDENIERSVAVYDKFCKARKNKTLEKLVVGKKIAVVGNGPQQVDRGTGAEIDAHDIVIRFNNFRTDGYEKDYGKRTDIWVWGAGAGTLGDKERAIYKNVKLMMWGPEFGHFKIMENYCDWLYQTGMKKIDHFPRDNFIELHGKLNLSIENGDCPSLGTTSIYFLLKSAKPKSVDFYGFSFLENKSGANFAHYYEKGNESGYHPHDLDAESEFLRQLIKGTTK
jgi:hypothetical protein